MGYAAVRIMINVALEHELQTRSLEHKLSLRLAPLQRTNSCLNTNVTRLMDFIRAYIAHLPQLLDALRETAQHSGLSTQIRPILELMEDFVLQGSGLNPDQRQLEELLDESYLAHKLIDVLNTYHRQKFNDDLIPLNMASANLIVHTLIGEPFAQELDQLAKDAAQGLLYSIRGISHIQSWKTSWDQSIHKYRLNFSHIGWIDRCAAHPLLAC